jgi:membrane-associated protease RseP (regulator of RpoE activity)
VSAVGVVAAIVVLLLSIMLHEAGHFLTAKAFGMKATRFFLGFGPTVWSFRRGETEYGVKAIPAGGFVKIVGMTPLEEIEPGDEERVFYKQPAGQRAVVLSAGSFVHLVLAVVMTYLVLVFVGDLGANRAAVYVAETPACVFLDPNQQGCKATDPKSPAHGVLHPGDRLLSVDGKPIHSGDTLRNALRVGVPTQLVVKRGRQQLSMSITPVAITQKVKGKETQLPKIGILLSDRPDPPSISALGAVPRTFSTMGSFLSQTVQGLGRIPHTLGDVLSGKQRTVNDVGTVVAATRFSGEIAGTSQIPLGVRIGEFFLLMAGLNFFIGVFNMLPLLPLDGGHVGILGFEQARSRLARLLRRPDPGRVDLNKVMPLTYAVFVVIVGMSLILLYADIFRPIKLNG